MHLRPESIAAVSKKHIFDGKRNATRIYNESRALKWKNGWKIAWILETSGIFQQISTKGNHDGIYSGLLPKAFNAAIEERSMKHYEDADAGTEKVASLIPRPSPRASAASPFLIIMNKNFYAFTNRISQLISTRMQLEIRATRVYVWRESH